MSAVLSPCGTWRLRLDRCLTPAVGTKVIAYFGVNPSTADAELDDQTVRKLRVFTERLDGYRFILGNAYAYRATDVRQLAQLSLPDVVGPENDLHLQTMIEEAHVLVPCWGSRDKLPKSLHHRLDELLGKLVRSGKPVLTLGLTASGDPKHPLMLGYNTPFVPYPMPEHP